MGFTNLVATALLIIGLNQGAWAHPNAGDRVVFATQIDKSELTLEYVNKGFNSIKNVWKVDFKTAINGVTQNQGTQEYLPEDMVSTATMQALLSNCESQGGKKVQVTTSVGTFETCYQASGDMETWYGDVPFGIVAFSTVAKKQKYHFQLTVLELGGQQ